MKEPPENQRIIYQFGRFVLDPQEKTLLIDGQPIHLPAKEFETLLLLVENNGRVLSKEEMLEKIWPGTYVEENNLAKYVSRLRKLLNSGGEVTIETLPKHGYRFSAEVSQILQPAEETILEKRTVRRVTVAYQKDDDDQLLPTEVRRKQLPGSRRRNYLFGLLIGGMFLALLGALLYFRVANKSKPTGNVSAVRSVAVLPFKPVGADGGDEYLRLGLTDALITKLSGMKQIVVRPTSAVRNYGTQDPLAAGRDLSVDVVVDGNVQKIGQRIRVTVQLVNVRDGAVLWGGKFDEQFTDIFRLQDAISEQVARTLEPALTGAEKTSLAKHYTTNTEAHDAYVRGRFFWNRRTPNDLKEAIKHFNQAVAKDQKYALAYAGLADAYSLLADYSAASPKDSYEKAREAGLKALELDDNLAEAHTSLAYVKMYYYWDWGGAESGYQRAMALNPNYATAHQWYSEYLTAMGRFDEALREIRRAKEIDPLSPIINAGEVWILYFARRYDEAIAQGLKVAAMNPEFAEIHEYLKRCYDQKGMYYEAVAARQTRRKLAGLDPVETATLRDAAAANNRETYWRKRLEQEIDDARREKPASFDMAEIFAQLGETEKAFEWLEKGYEERNYSMMYLKVAPNLDSLRSDSRFENLLRRIGVS